MGDHLYWELSLSNGYSAPKDATTRGRDGKVYISLPSPSPSPSPPLPGTVVLSCVRRFELLVPLEWTTGHTPMYIHLAGTGDHVS